MLHAAGFAAQWVTIIPSERLVIVRHGHSLHPAAWNHSKFIADVREALAIGRE
jgi:CubicO group peptidase (beta-lactamase class C family)